jgi:predicted DCC family thiol-disulfide oxidoreductase YuxK
MRRLFYDTSCPACKRIVNRIKSQNNSKLFMMSSLDGKKAKLIFQGNYAFLRKKKSRMVIVEGPRVWVKGNAMFRPYWLMGGKWKMLGIFSFLPGFMTSPFISLWIRVLRLFDKKK